MFKHKELANSADSDQFDLTLAVRVYVRAVL